MTLGKLKPNDEAKPGKPCVHPYEPIGFKHFLPKSFDNAIIGYIRDLLVSQGMMRGRERGTWKAHTTHTTTTFHVVPWHSCTS